jgi:hypothetical protein
MKGISWKKMLQILYNIFHIYSVMSKHNKHSSGKIMCDKHEQIQNMKTNVFLRLATVYTQ